MICKATVEKFCRIGEIHLIENYDKAMEDTTQTWVCHHRLELTMNGEYAHNVDELKRMGMYYNRPYFELIFLKAKEHSILHGKSGCPAFYKFLKVAHKTNKGRKWTDEQRDKLKGRKPHNSGKPTTYFGKKFYEHYGITAKDDKKLYYKELVYYNWHKKLSWEVR